MNIGRVLSRTSEYSSEYAGGIVAYLGGGAVRVSFSAGAVYGGTIAVGGVVGYLGANTGCYKNINTNWVAPSDPMSVPFTLTGAIVGQQVAAPSSVIDNYYDEQMCILPGIGSNPIPPSISGVAEGWPTIGMIGNNLLIAWPGTPPQLYPTLPPYHPIEFLAAAPIYLENNETLENVQTDFTVSNGIAFPPPIFPNPLNPYTYPYIWESVDGFVDIQPTSNNATINNTGGVLQQDTLKVTLDNEPLYEKLVPIWVIR